MERLIAITLISIGGCLFGGGFMVGSSGSRVDTDAVARLIDAQTEKQAQERLREYTKDQLRTKRRMKPVIEFLEGQGGSFDADWHREFGE